MKKTKEKRAYKFRAVIKKKSLYFYNCDGCGKKRSSRIYERALGKICQVCFKGKVPENQPSLFPPDIDPEYRITDKGRELLKEAREKGVDVSELLKDHPVST